MPSQVITSTENNFTKGLITESTGLNFPENAATDTDNCEYTLVGDVLRREGIDFELNYSSSSVNRIGNAISTYKWNNAGGDGNTQLLVTQVGGFLYFYNISSTTFETPLSTQKLSSTISLGTYLALGSTFSASIECTYSDGNGYLFVYHPNCDPIYVNYVSGAVSATVITIQVRDFTGLQDSLAVNTRPTTLSAEHSYNLTNQGWIASPGWIANANAVVVVVGSNVFTVQSGLGATNGQVVAGSGTQGTFAGTVTSYGGTTLTVNITSYSPAGGFPGPVTPWTIQPTNTGYISTWFTAEGNYPSNADIWWRFKDNSGVFNPAVMQPNVTLSLGQAPQGHYILPAFNMNRSSSSGISGLTSVSTSVRPTIGTWFQGRVWYAGTNASVTASGDASAYSWSENIYFSQINLSTTNNFGSCYQVNDPTSEELFDILPTDGGVLNIQGSGRVFKLFPIQNGMLVFAANGIWFITGSQGIGFAANDYTITKISNVESISSTSFVNVLGLPFFWNEEGIYQISTSQNNGLTVNPITVGTIQTFYNSIPKQSKKFVKGAYNPIEYVIQWIYKDVNEISITDRYSFNKILNYNTYNKAFFPYSLNINSASINSIDYIQAPGGSSSPDPTFKYFASTNTIVTFADEHDTDYLDWSQVGDPTDYSSYFITGYKLHGQGQRRFQIPYIYVYSRNDTPTQYKIQGMWDYAISGNSGRWSTAQIARIWSPNFGMMFRRHKIRGQGLVLQIKINSVSGQPFDIVGWSSFETQNTGI